MGTPDFAVPALEALLESDYELAGVVTQPDRPSGRGRQLTASPVKQAAEAAGIDVLQPKSLKDEAAQAELGRLEPDLIVVVAFGQILPKAVLEIPPHGCLNLHASLLPRWRGAAPVAAAIRSGDQKTGVTLMLMDEGLDTGPIVAQQPILIRPAHSRETLTNELAERGAMLLINKLPPWLAGEIEARPQDESQATHAPRLKKEEGLIDWSQSAVDIERKIQAFYPWPGTFTYGPRGRIKILAIETWSQLTAPSGLEPGALFEADGRLFVATGQGAVRLVTVQPEGKKAMAAEAMLNGQPELLKSRLGQADG